MSQSLANRDPADDSPSMEARMSALEKRIDRIDERLDGIDDRLRAVERSVTELGAKMDILISQVIAKLPTWWQMPAVIGATVVLLAGLYGGVRWLQVNGLL